MEDVSEKQAQPTKRITKKCSDRKEEKRQKQKMLVKANKEKIK